MRSIKALFPTQFFIPTGGVEIREDNIREWIRAGVAAVGMGSKLISEEVLIEAKYDLLYENTLLALEIVRKVKNEIYPKR
jgi:2-dehydro-3-deoxyphosphogluconate aldolase/(4S)-4-hydroxy-2-oxoglutarate aldolase